MAIIRSAPPADEIPEIFRPLVAELIDLRRKLSAASAESSRLNYVDNARRLATAARRADAALLAEAARRGDPLDKVGTPNQDRLAQEQAAARTKVRGLKQALAQTGRELGNLMREHARPAIADLETQVRDAADSYQRAITDLEAARAQFWAVCGVRNFFERAVGAHPTDDVHYVARIPSLPRGIDATDGSFFAKLREEAINQGRPAPRRRTKGPGFTAA